MIELFGTESSLRDYKEIIERELGVTKVISGIKYFDGRMSFLAELSQDDLVFLQENFWYTKNPAADMNWNCCIAFQKLS